MSEVSSAKNPLPLFQFVANDGQEMTLVSWHDLPEWGSDGKDHFAVLCSVQVGAEGEPTHTAYYEGTVTVDEKPTSRDHVKVKVSPVEGTHIPALTFLPKA